MTEAELLPYVTAAASILNVALLGYLLNMLRQIQEIGKERSAVQEMRLKALEDDLKKTEKWAEREKADLRNEIEDYKEQLDVVLKKEGINLQTLALGRKISESTTEVRETVLHLVEEMKKKLDELQTVNKALPADPEWRLSLAMGALATGSYPQAASYFDDYANKNKQPWQAHFSRGIAHANARQGQSSDLAALRAYNDAIAVAPSDVDRNMRARIFCYRGAMLKRLGRLDEAEADLTIALKDATREHEILDSHYNLACVFAMRGEREKMINEIRWVVKSAKFKQAISQARDGYFKNFANDPEFRSLLGV